MNSAQADRTPSAVAAVILAAGASSRMGTPKLLLRWGGATIVEHLIRQWEGLGADPVAIVTRSGDQALQSELDRLAVPMANRIENPQPERGMFSSIQCAANWDGWAGAGAWAIVLGDQPHLRPDTLRALLAFQSQQPEAICQPEWNGRARHPVVLPRPVFEELKLSKADSLGEFLKHTSCRRARCSLEDSGLGLDLDSPEDYRRALASLD